MKLSEKTLTIKDGGTLTLTPEWVNSEFGEIYNLSYAKKGSSESKHYGYMTEALVSLLETTDKKGNPYFDRVGFANPKKKSATI